MKNLMSKITQSFLKKSEKAGRLHEKFLDKASA
jgi:hypothetical protein